MCEVGGISRQERGKKRGRDDYWFPGRGFLEQLVPCHEAQSTPREESERFQQVSADLAIACLQLVEDPPVRTSQSVLNIVPSLRG